MIGADKRAVVRRLIEEGRLTTAYQPIWDISNGTLLGVEALTRPDADYGLSRPGRGVRHRRADGTCPRPRRLCVKSALAGAPDLPDGALLFVNLCPRTLDLDADENDWLRLAVEHAGISTERVVIEITERFGGRAAAIVKCLQRLRSQGFKIAVDDVGTGNSGLAILSQVKAEFVKLDRSIVAAAATDPGARAMLMAVATYARQTDAFVIAEGIEDDETLEFLHGIDELERRPHPRRPGIRPRPPDSDHPVHPRITSADPVQGRLTTKRGAGCQVQLGLGRLRRRAGTGPCATSSSLQYRRRDP